MNRHLCQDKLTHRSVTTYAYFPEDAAREFALKELKEPYMAVIRVSGKYRCSGVFLVITRNKSRFISIKKA